MHPTRQKLLDTGLAIATDKGLRGLTVRELAAAAEVNLGTFVYHFGNRDAFIDELVELWYAPLYDELKTVAAKGTYPCALATFEATMEALIGLVARQRSFINHLFGDALAGGRVAGGGPPAPADDLHHGFGRPAAGDRRQRSPARLAAPGGGPLSVPDRQPRGCPATPGMGPARPAPHRRRSRMKQRIALLAVLLALLGGYLWWQGRPEGDPV